MFVMLKNMKTKKKLSLLMVIFILDFFIFGAESYLGYKGNGFSQGLWGTATFALLLLGCITGILTLLWGFLILRSLQPFSQIAEVLKEISEGNADLSRRISVGSQDEIGETAKHLNRFIEKVQGMVLNVYDMTLEVSKATGSLTGISSDMASGSQNLTTRIHVADSAVKDIASHMESLLQSFGVTKGNIGTVASAVEEMSGTTRNLAMASEQTSAGVMKVSELASNISRSIFVLSNSSKDVSSMVSSVATAVKEINLSLGEISRNCERSIHITSDASEKATDTNTIISRLDNSSKQIEKIISVINNIADQTNMLALNAAIEAAGAGEAGKGFSVVANEVKELAKQTSEATDEISQQIEAMQINMAGAVKAVEVITGVIREINVITNTIAAAVTEQSASTGDILSAVVRSSDQVNHITTEIGEIASNSEKTARSIAEASKEIKEIARSATEISSATNEAAKNIDKISNTVKEVDSVSHNISGKVTEVSKYIAEVNTMMGSVASSSGKARDYAGTLSRIARKLEGLGNHFKI